ncbi:Uncharacterised protein [Mycobacterium tuberculosis]|nr:Uncharacterised protein [Mycobacterium tuberculosis]
MVEGGVDGHPVAFDAGGKLDEYRDATALGPGDPPVQGLFTFLALDRKHMPQALFEQVGAIQTGIGLGDPGQFGALAFGEVLGVLPQRVAGALEPPCPLAARTWCGVLTGPAPAPLGFGARDRPCVVPGSAPLDVERLGGPGHHMKRIGALNRIRAALGDHVSDPVRGIGRNVSNLGGPLSAQGIEEQAQGGLVVARGGPHQPAAVVIDDHRQVPVVALVGDLIDTDAAQVREPVNALFGVGPDPGHDRPDGAPGDPHQLAHRGLRTRHRQPGHRVIESIRVPGMMTRPRHRHHRRPMGGAVHPRRLGLQEHLDGAPIQTAPLAQARTAVIPGRLATAATTAAQHCTSWPHPGDHPRTVSGVILLEFDILNHGALVDTQQRTK